MFWRSAIKQETLLTHFSSPQFRLCQSPLGAPLLPPAGVAALFHLSLFDLLLTWCSLSSFTLVFRVSASISTHSTCLLHSLRGPRDTKLMVYKSERTCPPSPAAAPPEAPSPVGPSAASSPERSFTGPLGAPFSRSPSILQVFRSMASCPPPPPMAPAVTSSWTAAATLAGSLLQACSSAGEPARAATDHTPALSISLRDPSHPCQTTCSCDLSRK